MTLRFWILLGAIMLQTLSVSAEPAVPAHAERVVTIDWGLAETLIALGAPPLGLAETRGYRDWVTAPPLPESVAEIGLRSTPNLEYIANLRPDIILSTPQFAAVEPMLEGIAPVLDLAIYTTDLDPYQKAIEVTRRLGTLLGLEAEAQHLISETEQRLDRLAGAVGGLHLRKVLIVNFHDDRHVWVYTEGSLYNDVLKRAGIRNAWSGSGSFWGIANVSVDRFADLEDTVVLIVEPVPPSIRGKLEKRDDDTMVGRMAPFKEGNYRILPAVWGFGGLPSAGRFAEMLLQQVDFLKAGDAG
jgi:ferric hydroxamate transport system substrate-binding protein